MYMTLYADDIQNAREQTRAKRVLADFCKLLMLDLWKLAKCGSNKARPATTKVIGALGPTSIASLREFYDASKTDLVFSRSGNISPKFYRILREACERAGVPYGRKNPNGLVLHDARSSLRSTQFQTQALRSIQLLAETPRAQTHQHDREQHQRQQIRIDHLDADTFQHHATR